MFNYSEIFIKHVCLLFSKFDLYLTEIGNVSYCCTKNLLNIIKGHHEIVTNMNDFPIDGNFQTSRIIYKYISSATINPGKVYRETGEKNFKK